MSFSQPVECIVIQLFGFWCAIRDSNLAHVDSSGGFGKSGAGQLTLVEINIYARNYV